MKEKALVAIILPILNEAAHIEKLIAEIDKALSGYSYLTIIIDDGSTDGTIEKIHALTAKFQDKIHLIQRKKEIPGCQRGSALNLGMKWALNNTSASVFVELDGDLSHLPKEMPGGIEPVLKGQCDVVIVSKYLRESKVVNRSKKRIFISFINSLLMRSLLKFSITDYSNGYRFYGRKAAELLSGFQIKNGSPIYLSEALAIWMKSGMRVKEIHGTYIGRSEGSSKVIVFDLVKGMAAVVDISLRYHLFGFKKSL